MSAQSRLFFSRLILTAAVLFFNLPAWAAQPAAGAGEEYRLITLTQGIDLVQKNSPMIKAALPDDAISFQDSLLARSALLPQLNAYVNKVFNHNVPGAILDTASAQTGERNTVAYGFDVYQTIFDFGKSLSNFKASRQVYKATQAHTESIKHLATLEFIVAYFNVLEAQQMIAVSAKEVDSLKAYLNDIGLLYAQGVVVENDLLPAKIRLADAQQRLIATNNYKETAIARLNNLLGLPLGEKIRVEDITMEPPQFPNLEQAQNAAINLRPEIVFYADQIKASQLLVQAKKVQNYPEVFADAGYGFQQNRFLTHEYNSSLVLGAKIDLYDGGAAQAQLLKERARGKQLNEQKSKLGEDIKFEIQDSYYALKNACEKVQVAHGALEQAEENLRFYRIKYNAGGATTTEVLEAITLQTRAQANFYTNNYEMKRSYAKLMYSMGLDLSLIYEKMEN